MHRLAMALAVRPGHCWACCGAVALAIKILYYIPGSQIGFFCILAFICLV